MIVSGLERQTNCISSSQVRFDMISQKLKAYYDATEEREIRADLIFAAELVGTPKVAIDCGCGAGADIQFLLSLGFEVHGFDIEEDAISRCEKRFKNNKKVFLTKSGFASYTYPKASLVLADASLFFCPESEFDRVWRELTHCLYPNGVFCGSFLGPEDSMAAPDYDKSESWPNVLVLDEEKVKGLFEAFHIHRFTEHKTSGRTVLDVPHNWHIYSVVANKLP